MRQKLPGFSIAQFLKFSVMFLCMGEKRFRLPKLHRTKDHPDLGAKVRHKSVTIKILELNNVAQTNRNFIYNIHFAFKKIINKSGSLCIQILSSAA